jgi:ubiquinone/menaquinone biosynthesis C-methylase UbiE
MGITEEIGRQCRMPQGRFGAFWLRTMNIAHSRLTQWGLRHVKIRESDTILDVGCGGGKTVSDLAKIATEGKVYGIDYSEASVAIATSVNKRYINAGRVEIYHASVESLPFPDDMFDLVTAVETYFFWPDLVNNLKEIRRVLKPGGHLAIVNEAYRDERFEKRNAIFAKAGNFTYHSPDEFYTFLKDAGYSHVQIDVLPAKNWIAATGIK